MSANFHFQLKRELETLKGKEEKRVSDTERKDELMYIVCAYVRMIRRVSEKKGNDK